jgi:hypothetical protein
MRGQGVERRSALREGKTLKVESQERYRGEMTLERFREEETGESVRNAEAGPRRARKARVTRIPDSVSAEGNWKPRKVVDHRRTLPPTRGAVTARERDESTGAARRFGGGQGSAGRRQVSSSTPWRGARGSERSVMSGP